MEMSYRGKPASDPIIVDTRAKEEAASDQQSTDNEQTAKLESYISFIPTIAFDATLQASWEAFAISIQAGLLNGGPVSLVWGTLMASIGSAAIAASLGEMASITPSVGAQYRWTAIYAPPHGPSPAFWSLLQGWITVFAWIATAAQVAYLEGTLVQGLIILNDETYVPQLWHGTLLGWAILALAFSANIFARKILPPLEYVGGVLHIALFVIFVAVLTTLSPHKSASFVFTKSITGLSGWDNHGIQFCLGLLSAAFPLTGFDGVIHMSAEVHNPAKRVPQSMVYTVLINGTLTFAFAICLLFTLGDFDNALNTATGYPVIEILHQATASKAATTILMILIVFTGIIAIFSALASASRLVWAFALDKGLPFSPFFSRVDPRVKIPLNSLGLVAVIIMLLLLISVGSTTAFNAILSLGTLSLYISYILPMVFMILKRLRGERIPQGPFSLGRWGLPLNLFATLYAIFIAVFLPFPPRLPVTAANMNYSGPVMGIVILLALGDWFISGKKRFKVPVDPAVLALENEDRKGSTSGDGAA